MGHTKSIMFKVIIHAFIAIMSCLAWAQPGSAQVNPEAVQLTGDSMAFLAKKKHVSTSWFATYDSGDNARNSVTTTWNGKSRLSRNKGYYAISERLDESYEYFYDGEVFTAKNVDGQYYTQKPITGSFDELVGALSKENNLTLPVWELLSEDVSSELVVGVTKAEYLGVTKIMGQDAHHLKLFKPEREWEMWISNDAKRPVPLMIIGFTPENGGSHYQAMFYEWSFKPVVNRRKFVFRSGAKDLRVDWDTFKKRSIQGGEFSDHK